MRKYNIGLVNFLTAFFLASPTSLLAERTLLDDAVRLMYNNEFAASHRLLDQHVLRQPQDPLAFTFRATAHLFSEFDRLGILESEFFASDQQLAAKTKLKADPGVRVSFFQSVETSDNLAAQALRLNPKDTNALFAIATNLSLISDYRAFIDKHHWASYQSARQAQIAALKLLDADPNFHDAMLSTGMNEYLMGSIPGFLRWFVKFERTKGNKNLGRQQLWTVAHSGRYFGPFARILLAVIYLREKDYTRSEEIVLQLSREFPANKLLSTELAKLRVKTKK